MAGPTWHISRQWVHNQSSLTHSTPCQTSFNEYCNELLLAEEFRTWKDKKASVTSFGARWPPGVGPPATNIILCAQPQEEATFPFQPREGATDSVQPRQDAHCTHGLRRGIESIGREGGVSDGGHHKGAIFLLLSNREQRTPQPHTSAVGMNIFRIPGRSGIGGV